MNTDHLFQPRNGYKPGDIVLFEGRIHNVMMLSEGGLHLKVGPDRYDFITPPVMDIGYDEISQPLHLVPAGDLHWCIAAD